MNKPSDHPRKALGRGISALIPARTSPSPAEPPPGAPEPVDSITNLRIESIDPNPMQPRSVFHQDRLQELAQSIRANGIIQPLVARRRGDRFQLVAGERRWRAAKLAGLSEVPVVVREFADDKLLEVTLIENIQREDLNAIEIAHALERLHKDLALTHEEIARRTGKDRTTVTNMLRLLRLPGDVQALIAEHRLSMGHARAILGLPTPELQRQAAERVTAQGLSVRQAERLVNRMTETREPKSADEAEQDPNVKAAVQELERALGTRVRIVEKSDQRGRIEIEYFSQEELQRLYQLIIGETS
ncbi:MAG: ParB/RepB/Spo0J family partition protein [Bryobacterales bacterium]|nr:ParB/RepB/Spo0J family partition protein [Bryobacterales bacterium]